MTLQPFAIYSGAPQNIFVLVSLLVCLIPTTIGGLLSAIGIAGMDRMIQRNVIAMSGRAVEASGDVDVLLLDKTGTITLGNRQATRFFRGARRHRNRNGRRGATRFDRRRNARRALHRGAGQSRNTACADASSLSYNPMFIPFSAQTRMSGVDLDGHEDPQRRAGRHRQIRRRARQSRPQGSDRGWSNASPAPAARLCW